MAGLPRDWPDQLGLDGFEEREEDLKTVRWAVFPTKNHRVVAVPASAHRDQNAAFAEKRLIVDRAVLRSSVGMMGQPRRGVTSHQGIAQGFHGKIALQAVTRGPTDDVPREEVKNDREVEPALCRPDVGNVRPPLPVLTIRREVLRHQVRGLRGSENDPGDRFPELRPGMFAVCRAL